MPRTVKTTDTTTNGSTEKEHVDLASRIQEIDMIGGYVTSKRVSAIFTDAASKDVPVTTVNNLAYAGKIDVVKIGGIFLFKLEGDNSVNAYIPTLLARGEKSAEKKEQEARAQKQKQAKELFKKYVNDALAKGEMPDLDAVKRELGLE